MKHLDPALYFWAISNMQDAPVPFKKDTYRQLWMDCIDDPQETRQAVTWQQVRSMCSMSVLLRQVKAKFPEVKPSRVPGLLARGIPNA